MELIACEWGQSKTFMLPFIEYGASDFKAGVTLATGDAQISKGGAAFVNMTNLPTIVGKWMLITLTPAEMQYGFVSIEIIDKTATKIFEDQGAILTTNVKEWMRTLFILQESQRGSHSGEGEMIFWDPDNVTGVASDANSGLIYHEPKLTYNYNGANGVHDLLVDDGHQIIKGISGPGGVPTTVNEYICIDKSYNFLRCDGRNFLIKATHNESEAILLSAEGTELSGLIAETKVTGSQDAIAISGDFAKIKSVWIDQSRGNGILIDNASSCVLEDYLIQDAALGGSGHAVHILGDVSTTERNLVGAGRIFSNGNGGQTDGIRIDGEFCDHNFIHGGKSQLIIHDNTGWGINEVNGADETIIVGPTVHVGHNDLGRINLTGVESTVENTEQWATSVNLATLQTSVDAIPTAQVSVLAFPGTFSPSFATRGGKIPYPIKTLSSFSYDFKTDISSADSVWFALKENLKDTNLEYIIDPKDITAYIDDPLLGTGLVPITVLESTVIPKVYYGEVQTRDAGGNATASWQFKLEMIDKVMN